MVICNIVNQFLSFNGIRFSDAVSRSSLTGLEKLFSVNLRMTTGLIWFIIFNASMSWFGTTLLAPSIISGEVKLNFFMDW